MGRRRAQGTARGRCLNPTATVPPIGRGRRCRHTARRKDAMRYPLYRWKVTLASENGVGLYTEVLGEDADAAADNAQHMSGLEAIMVESIDPAWTEGHTLDGRLAA